MFKESTKFIFTVTILLFSLTVGAQNEVTNPEKVRVRIESNENGNKRVVVKDFDTKGMSTEEREAVIEAYTDQAMARIGKSGRMKITIEGMNPGGFEEEDRFSLEGERADSFEFENDSQRQQRPEIHIYKKKNRKGSDLEYGFDRFGDTMRQLGEDIPRRIEQNLPRIYTWDKGRMVIDRVGTVQSLEVFPNRPSNNLVNIRFFIPKKGNVLITVLNLQGEIVGKEELLDFGGEYAGQVKIKDKPVGSYFVLVSKEGDGITKKVTFPEN